MRFNSLEDLKRVVEENKDMVSLRLQKQSNTQNNAQNSAHNNAHNIEVLIGMATDGISSGAKETFNAFQKEISAHSLENIKVVPVGSLGIGYTEPIVQVNIPGEKSVVYGNVLKDDVAEIVEKHLSGRNPVERLMTEKNVEEKIGQKQLKIALKNCGVVNPEDITEYVAFGGYESLGKILTQMSPDDVINEIKMSQLRGRGGGGFSTGLKWEITRRNNADEKFIICNADEGDPGAFMDRSILEGDPHCVIEGMAIAAYAIGAQKGIIYIRAEYPLAIKRVSNAMVQAREAGLLGENILGMGFKFDIKLKYGAGAFVCGEETALINSCEGKRGEPNYKPPYPAEQGYWGYPTCVNNVETLANIPRIIGNGASWFASIGTEKSKGTKVFALTGKVNNVGLVEIPMGTTLREIIFDIGGGIKDNKMFKAVQTGGPSGGVIPEKHLDIPIDYDSLLEIGSMMGSGGMIVMDETDNMVEIAKFYLEFSMDESCGRCTPCRIGTKRLYEKLCKIKAGKATKEDIDQLKALAQMVRESSLCGLGQSAPNPIISTMKHFWDEYRALIKDVDASSGEGKYRAKNRIGIKS